MYATLFSIVDDCKSRVYAKSFETAIQNVEQSSPMKEFLEYNIRRQSMRGRIFTSGTRANSG